MPMGYTIRPARPEELELLPEIERRSASLFDGLAVVAGVVGDVTTLADFMAGLEAGRLWVAISPEGQPVGFALVDMVDGHAHLDEIDVLPEHGRRGVGRALVETVCDWVRREGLGAVTLTTFSDVPWNAPFYAKLGFRALSDAELTPALEALVRAEHAGGLLREHRVVMRLDVDHES